MGKAMSNDTNSIIVRALAQGHSRNDIAKMCGVSTRAVTRVSTNLKKHGTPRAPPSGLKQGRPARMTRKQADALLAWITARNYTFYVKDLVAFLRDHHGYQGCDGTVRRGMIRAGFKRKEPYHKSEITVWTPPDHPPNFDVILDDEQRRPPKSKENAAPQQQVQQPQQPPASVPPVTPQQQAPAAPMTSGSLDAGGMLSAYPNYYHQHHVAFQAQQPIPPLDPDLYDMEAQQNPQAPHPSKSPAKKPKKPKKEEQLQTQVASMQGELAKQSELIRQLQMQLAQSQNHSPSAQQAPQMTQDNPIEANQQRQYPGHAHSQGEEVAV